MLVRTWKVSERVPPTFTHNRMIVRPEPDAQAKSAMQEVFVHCCEDGIAGYSQRVRTVEEHFAN